MRKATRMMLTANRYDDRDGGWEVRPIDYRGQRRDSRGRYMSYMDDGQDYRDTRMGFSDTMPYYPGMTTGHEPHDQEPGSAKSRMYPGKFTRDMAEEWVGKMTAPDGARGGHWTYEQTEQVRKQKGLNDLDPCEFYITMNMLYSDYQPVAAKLNVNNVDFYVAMTKAFLDDEDAAPGKLMNYYRSIVSKD